MKEKLLVEFKRVNIEIKSTDGKINCSIPYCFDIEYGEKNIKYLFEHLGFEVEMKKEKKTEENELVIFLDIPGKHRIGYVSETRFREIIKEEIGKYIKKETERICFKK